jgi:Rrf2 family protein
VLARNYGNGPLSTTAISAEKDIPEKFLETILQELTRARLLVSNRGAKGGFRLNRAPSDISLRDIIELMEGTIAPFQNSKQLQKLASAGQDDRRLYEAFCKLHRAAAEILENTTLADLVGSATDERTLIAKKEFPKRS